ncbi:hypothetical protein, partial [Streptomyces resistomycificus]|uniref:Uncharacterized protein n=1 Tax=Streptomyces resistomycificus TaxID=67356 RepID=A0A0L8L595_9ACTN
MGREVRRVPLDFDWPFNKIWDGFLSPDRFDEEKCPDCANGYSPRAQNLYDLWYGKIPFDLATTGSTPWGPDTPAIRTRAEQNIANAPEYYGSGEPAIVREARRLADLFNGSWSHHLAQEDVDALVAGERLHDFTHTWTRENGWQPKEPPVVPTAAQVNEWSLAGLAHDGINASVVIRARCEREGIDDTCPTCKGYASLEKYEGQRAEAEAWEPTEPPKGDGWQLWETVSEGSPISPVFAAAEELADWMSSPAYTWGAVKADSDRPSYESALSFVKSGWAPSFVSTAQTGVVSGVEWIGAQGD